MRLAKYAEMDNSFIRPLAQIAGGFSAHKFFFGCEREEEILRLVKKKCVECSGFMLVSWTNCREKAAVSADQRGYWFPGTAGGKRCRYNPRTTTELAPEEIQ